LAFVPKIYFSIAQLYQISISGIFGMSLLNAHSCISETSLRFAVAIFATTKARAVKC
jgi:hypothetical protein